MRSAATTWLPLPACPLVSLPPPQHARRYEQLTSGSEVVESHQYTSIGRETGLFKLIAQVMEAVDPLPYGTRGVFPRSQSPAEYLPAPKPVTPASATSR